MRIKVKSVIAIIVTTICLILILDFVSSTVIQSNFSKIEQDEVTQTIARVQVAVTNREMDIDSKLITWSQLNSTYDFIQNQTDAAYRGTYLTDSSLGNLGINFAMFLDEKGNYVTGMGLNLTTMNQIPVPQDIITKVSSEPLIWNLNAIDSYEWGFISSSGQPLMITSRPIFRTPGVRSTADGVLIFARFYDAAEISKLSGIMKYPMSTEMVDSWQQENSVQAIKDPTFIKPVNQNFILGYDVIDDVRGTPLFVIGATMPRTIYDQGLVITGYIGITLVIAGAVFSSTIVMLMEYSVLRRLSKLTEAVTKLGKRENHLQELTVSGNDEITWLTLSINGLLQEIDSQSNKLQKSERLSAIGELARQIGHDLRNPTS